MASFANPARNPMPLVYGHFEDAMVKENGKWLFSKRVVYNEQTKSRSVHIRASAMAL